MKYLLYPFFTGFEPEQEVFPAVQEQYERTETDADGLINSQLYQRQGPAEEFIQRYYKKKEDLPSKAAGKPAPEVKVGLLYCLQVREEHHKDQPGDKPLQHIAQLIPRVEPSPQPVGEQQDQSDEKKGDASIDKKGGRGDLGLHFLVVDAADIFDMGILQQGAFGKFEDTGDSKEQGPHTHLVHRQLAGEEHQVEESEKG